MKKCLYSMFLNQEKVNKKAKCWPSTDTVEGSDWCKLHLMRQEILADKKRQTLNNPTEKQV